MNYTDKKVNEIIDIIQNHIKHKTLTENFHATLVDNEIRLKIEEILKDSRHKIAENVVAIPPEMFNHEEVLISMNKVHNIVINTEIE